MAVGFVAGFVLVNSLLSALGSDSPSALRRSRSVSRPFFISFSNSFRPRELATERKDTTSDDRCSRVSSVLATSDDALTGAGVEVCGSKKSCSIVVKPRGISDANGRVPAERTAGGAEFILLKSKFSLAAMAVEEASLVLALEVLGLTPAADVVSSAGVKLFGVSALGRCLVLSRAVTTPSFAD